MGSSGLQPPKFHSEVRSITFARATGASPLPHRTLARQTRLLMGPFCTGKVYKIYAGRAGKVYKIYARGAAAAGGGAAIHLGGRISGWPRPSPGAASQQPCGDCRRTCQAPPFRGACQTSTSTCSRAAAPSRSLALAAQISTRRRRLAERDLAGLKLLRKLLLGGQLPYGVAWLVVANSGGELIGLWPVHLWHGHHRVGRRGGVGFGELPQQSLGERLSPGDAKLLCRNAPRLRRSLPKPRIDNLALPAIARGGRWHHDVNSRAASGGPGVDREVGRSKTAIGDRGDDVGLAPNVVLGALLVVTGPRWPIDPPAPKGEASIPGGKAGVYQQRIQKGHRVAEDSCGAALPHAHQKSLDRGGCNGGRGLWRGGGEGEGEGVSGPALAIAITDAAQQHAQAAHPIPVDPPRKRRLCSRSAHCSMPRQRTPCWSTSRKRRPCSAWAASPGGQHPAETPTATQRPLTSSALSILRACSVQAAAKAPGPSRSNMEAAGEVRALTNPLLVMGWPPYSPYGRTFGKTASKEEVASFSLYWDCIQLCWREDVSIDDLFAEERPGDPLASVPGVTKNGWEGPGPTAAQIEALSGSPVSGVGEGASGKVAMEAAEGMGEEVGEKTAEKAAEKAPGAAEAGKRKRAEEGEPEQAPPEKRAKPTAAAEEEGSEEEGSDKEGSDRDRNWVEDMATLSLRLTQACQMADYHGGFKGRYEATGGPEASKLLDETMHLFRKLARSEANGGKGGKKAIRQNMATLGKAADRIWEGYRGVADDTYASMQEAAKQGRREAKQRAPKPKLAAPKLAKGEEYLLDNTKAREHWQVAPLTSIGFNAKGVPKSWAEAVMDECARLAQYGDVGPFTLPPTVLGLYPNLKEAGSGWMGAPDMASLVGNMGGRPKSASNWLSLTTIYTYVDTLAKSAAVTRRETGQPLRRMWMAGEALLIGEGCLAPAYSHPLPAEHDVAHFILHRNRNHFASYWYDRTDGRHYFYDSMFGKRSGNMNAAVWTEDICWRIVCRVRYMIHCGFMLAGGPTSPPIYVSHPRQQDMDSCGVLSCCMASWIIHGTVGEGDAKGALVLPATYSTSQVNVARWTIMWTILHGKASNITAVGKDQGGTEGWAAPLGDVASWVAGGRKPPAATSAATRAAESKTTEAVAGSAGGREPSVKAVGGDG
ncbi:uncharacterized protein EV422DRAFT_508866 [Fimicolochytrium jonesii]|uniref:uncharacterized protein n=1 Tax=Fimicolochytrium jonesii TaxID=1396493 RepID=UPI0022FE8F1D|nr:uncharacterized protein EV422DRAFT_508866 [Fimicolochytrium jonesii]KAI8817536.1 hypothetical protein EV422DRAFT_508866 [Fimicolochytrium jonesii]